MTSNINKVQNEFKRWTTTKHGLVDLTESHQSKYPLLFSSLDKTVTKKVVSVQTMLKKTGHIFYLKQNKKNDDIDISAVGAAMEFDIEINELKRIAKKHPGGKSAEQIVKSIDAQVINSLLEKSPKKNIKLSNLKNEINDCINLIHKNSFRRPNFIITNNYKLLGCPNDGLSLTDVNLYQSKAIQDNKIIIGYKGSNFLEAGFVYGPYKIDKSGSIYAIMEMIRPELYMVLEF